MGSFFVLSFIFVQMCFARVGGGDGFSGGSYSSGAGSDGGGIEIIFIEIFIRLVIYAIESPLMGVPLLLFFCVGVFFFYKTMHSHHMTRRIKKAHSMEEFNILRKEKIN